MGVPQFTTPTFLLTFTEQGLDLTQAEKVFVTIKSGSSKLTKTGEALTVDEKQIGVKLNQRETGRLLGKVEIQANWLIDGDRYASDISLVDVSKNLLNEVVQ